MAKDELIKHLEKRLRAAEFDRDGFSDAIRKYGLRVIHRTSGSPERDVTAEHLKSLEDAVQEYRSLLRELSM
jgi:hypothetical protein